jgi:thiol-disulfide isomerase/thioredoxin
VSVLNQLKSTGEAGARQQEHILELAKLQIPRHVILLFHSPDCKHCQQVIPQIEQYVSSHPKINFIKIDASTEENTDFLEATLKGKLSVPVAIIDDIYVIVGDINFLHRLFYTMQLAENMPESKESEQKWLLRK